MTLDVELLISEVKKRPALYNTRLKEYCNRNLKVKLWTELSKQFVKNWHNLSSSQKAEKRKELQSKWKNVRTCFKREYNSQRKAPSSVPETKKRRKYVYFDQLLFLCNFMESRGTLSNLQSLAPNDVTRIGAPELIQPEKLRTIPIRSNTRKRKSTQGYDGALLDKPREKKAVDNEIDEDKYFLLSLLPSFQKFDEDQKFVARTEIMNVLRRVRLSKNMTLNAPILMNATNLSDEGTSRQYFTNFTPDVPGRKHSEKYAINTPSPSNQDELLSPIKQEDPWENGASDISSVYSIKQL